MRIRTFLTSLLCIAAVNFSASAAIRPEVGKPLQEAQKLAAAHDYKAAMARIAAADKVANKSEEETGLIREMRMYIHALTTGACKGQECDF